jgi:hypothetical protein
LVETLAVAQAELAALVHQAMTAAAVVVLVDIQALVDEQIPLLVVLVLPGLVAEAVVQAHPDFLLSEQVVVVLVF